MKSTLPASHSSGIDSKRHGEELEQSACTNVDFFFRLISDFEIRKTYAASRSGLCCIVTRLFKSECKNVIAVVFVMSCDGSDSLNGLFPSMLVCNTLPTDTPPRPNNQEPEVLQCVP